MGKWRGNSYLLLLAALVGLGTGCRPNINHHKDSVEPEIRAAIPAENFPAPAPSVPSVPRAPSYLNAVASDGKVMLSWGSVDGALSFVVYRGTESGFESMTPLESEAVGVVYLDTTVQTGTTYYYAVSAVNQVGEGPHSAMASATPMQSVSLPPIPKNVRVTVMDSELKLTWDIAQVDSYEVLLGINPNQLFSQGKTVDPFYHAKNLVNGTTYYLAVRSIRAGITSGNSTVVSAAPKAPTRVPDAPTGVHVQVGDKKVKISWDPTPDATHYAVLRGLDSPSTDLDKLARIVENYEGTSYIDLGLVNGTSYLYAVRAYNSAGGSAKSEILKAVPVESAIKLISASAGEGHTCYLMSSGEISCFGDYLSASLGNLGKLGPRPVKIENLNLKVAKSLTSGGFHSCALLETGEIQCWGDNSMGQLGNGSYQSSMKPVLVSGISDAVYVSAGRNHTCAIKKDTSMRCWGANSSGQLGNGSKAKSNVPVSVSVNRLGGPVLGIAGGLNHTCAIVQIVQAGSTSQFTKEVRCFGSNSDGILGLDPTTVEALQPTISVSEIKNAKDISLGDRYSCALLDDETVRCWGLGIVGDQASHLAKTVKNFTQVKSLSSGRAHVCARSGSGGVKCIGSNEFGQFGSGTTGQSFDPVAVSEINLVTEIGTGARHTCMVISQTAIKCFGDNRNGQLGNGFYGVSSESLAVQVQGLSDVRKVASGHSHTCAIYGAAGDVMCWGNNSMGQLGDGTNLIRSTPVKTLNVTGAVDLVAGEFHTCARLGIGAVKCWGDNRYGQLGDGTTNPSATPAIVRLDLKATEIKSGKRQSCAILENNQVACWGETPTGMAAKVVAGTEGAYSLAVADQYICVAVSTDSSVKCWGKILDGSTENPEPVLGLGRAYMVVGGGNHMCAVMQNDGTVYCWGSNTYGELGNGTLVNSTVPLKSLISGVVLTGSAGGNHTCFISQADGSVQCFGNGLMGQLGRGVSEFSSLPVKAKNILGAFNLSLGYQHSCVLLSNRTVSCFGSNVFGQIGNGRKAIEPLPVIVDMVF